MYIIKNAFRSITRSKGRNILIGIIVLIIAVASCIGLSIKQAANSAKEQSLDKLEITAQISVDRSKMMEEMKSETAEGEKFDPSTFKDKYNEVSSLTLDEMQTYANASSVENFYYTITASMNGSDDLSPVESSTAESETTSDSENSTGSEQFGGNAPGGGMPDDGGGRGFQKGGWGTQGDFTLTGYSADRAMTDFTSGVSTIVDGEMFEENTDQAQCIISDELATYNSLSVGDTITITNPNNEDETYELAITGIYSNSQSTVTSGGFMGGFSSSNDAANQIYTSFNALKAITTKSTEDAETQTDENTGTETTTAIPEQVSGTYVFANVDDYNAFESQAKALGLEDTYAISSSDISEFEQSLVPLENLSDMAMYFLFVVLGIGAVVLIVLNVFNIRERKYEVGVLTAIGMKKRKVTLQFITEIFTITFISIVLGTAIGTAASVPVANKLLESQVSATQSSSLQQQNAFGRTGSDIGQSGPGGNKASKAGIGASTVEYISEISSATNLTVVLQLLGIGILLTLIASGASVAFIMRYEPLKILSNRD